MILRAPALWVAMLALATPVAAQHDGANEPSVPDVPSGPARIVGSIENPDAPALVAGIELLLYALPPNGKPGMRRSFSDTAGSFVFESISNDPATAYLIGARYAGIPYPGDRVGFAAGETEKSVRIRVGEPTADGASVAVVEAQLELAWSGGRIGVAERIRFENRGARTAYVKPAERAKAAPLYRGALPAGADEFQIPLGIQPEGLVREGDELRFYGPLYPSAWPGPLSSDQGLAFYYTVPGASGAGVIEKRFPSGAERVVVLVPETGPKVEVAGAREEVAPGAQPADAAKPPRRLVVGRVPAGGRIAIRVDVPETRVDPDAVRLLESRIFLELDDAALQVQEEHVIEVSGALPVVAPDGAPLVTFPVPAGAADVKFGRDAFALGLAPDDAGGAGLRGPLPPGETRLPISYHLPVGTDGAALFEKRFGRRLPLLNIYVADTGLRTESERLHRRRPVKTTDRTYLALEAFEVEPSEVVRLSIAPLGAAAQMPRAALLGLVAIGAGLAFAFIAAPLRLEPGGAASIDELDDTTRSERDAVYAALRDLEHDRETGKLADDDYASMRSELRGRAAVLLRAEAAARPIRPAVPEAPPFRADACVACSAAVQPGDRFCARCGARIEAASGAGA